MRAPWTGKTGIAKLIAIFSTSLAIATGLCGLNFIAVANGANALEPASHWHILLSNLLNFGAWAELAVMLVSFVVLVLLGIVTWSRHIRRK